MDTENLDYKEKALETLNQTIATAVRRLGHATEWKLDDQEIEDLTRRLKLLLETKRLLESER
jgi:hypothetical protein